MSGRPSGPHQPVPDFQFAPGQLPTPYELICAVRHAHNYTSHGDLEDLAWNLGYSGANSVSHNIKAWQDGKAIPNLGVTIAMCVMIDRSIKCGLTLWLHWQTSHQHGNPTIGDCAKEIAQQHWMDVAWDGTLITEVM